MYQYIINEGEPSNHVVSDYRTIEHMLLSADCLMLPDTERKNYVKRGKGKL